MGCDEIEIVVKTAADGGSVAIAEDKVADAAKNDDQDEDADGKNAKNASVWILWEETIPLLENILQAVSDEDGKWEDDEDNRIGVKTTEDGGEQDKNQSDEIAAGTEAADCGEEAETGEKEDGETNDWGQEDTLDGATPGEDWRESEAKIREEVAGSKITREEKLASDLWARNEIYGQHTEAEGDKNTGDDEGETGEIFYCETKVGVQEGVEDDEEVKEDHMGCIDREEQDERKDETKNRIGALFSLNLRAEPEKESRPEHEHNERSAGAGEIQKRDTQDGHDAGEKGDVVFEPAVQEEDDEKTEGDGDEDGGEFYSVIAHAEEENADLLNDMIWQIYEISAGDARKMEIVARHDALLLCFTQTIWGDAG